MKLFFFTLLALIFSRIVGANCQPHRFIPFQAKQHNGNYLRVHPSGSFVMLTKFFVDGNEEDVVILDLRTDPPTIIKTPFRDEAYPVEPDWKFIASPNHKDGMRYYSFSDVIKLKNEKIKNWDNNVKPIFVDRSHNEFYHSTASMGESTGGKTNFRTLLWENQTYRDYTVECSSIECKKTNQSERKHLCEPNFVSDKKRRDIHKLRERRLAIQAEITKITYTYRKMDLNDLRTVNIKSKELELELEKLTTELEELVKKLFTLNREVYNNFRGFLDQPILSKDGKHVAGSKNGETFIYSINSDQSCDIVEHFPNTGGKVSFSYPSKTKKGALVFHKGDLTQLNSPKIKEGDELPNRIYVYDRDRKKLLKISSKDEEESLYPGFTKDGRVIYRTRIKGIEGLMVTRVYSANSQLCTNYNGSSNEQKSTIDQ